MKIYHNVTFRPTVIWRYLWCSKVFVKRKLNRLLLILHTANIFDGIPWNYFLTAHTL